MVSPSASLSHDRARSVTRTRVICDFEVNDFECLMAAPELCHRSAILNVGQIPLARGGFLDRGTLPDTWRLSGGAKCVCVGQFR